MSYAARADLAERYGVDELDDRAPVGAGGASRADAAVADASAEIDAILGRSYALPLGAGPWPALLDACCALARERLYDDGSIPKAARREASAARAAVGGIADGERELVDAAGGIAARATRASFDGEAPRLRRSSLRDA